jgi:ARG and Rhodanese-Phosphatase-superfamily-associated Protein domain
MSAMFDTWHGALDAFVATFTPVGRQVGAVFFVNGRAAGLELFDAARTWRTLAPKLIRSYALDALDQEDGPVQSDAAADAMALIHELMSSQASVYPAVGEGTDVRFDGAGALGAALVTSDRAVHVSAFPVESAGTRNRNKGRRPRRNGASQADDM